MKFSKMMSILIFASIIILFSTVVFAQDTTGVISDTSKAVQSADDVEIGEIELMEITIEAIVEKPRVSILPKRMEPQLGEMEFIDRSFETELKEGPKQPFLIEERMITPLKIKKLKNKLKDKAENKN